MLGDGLATHERNGRPPYIHARNTSTPAGPAWLRFKVINFYRSQQSERSALVCFLSADVGRMIRPKK